MKFKNQIINYFIVPSTEKDASPEIYLSPVTMSAKIWSSILKKDLGKVKSSEKPIHVCFDVDSGRIYLPNSNEFMPSQIQANLNIAKERILKDFGHVSDKTPINGSPFSSIRVRAISSFRYVQESLFKIFGNFKDIPVIEANLARMPKTKKQLPCIYHKGKNYVGGFVSKESGMDIEFLEELDVNGKLNKNPKILLKQETPFILIDISPSVKPTSVEKEWAVMSGYRDYLYSNSETKKDLNSINIFADLYAAKRYLYLGWPFEEVCQLFLEKANNFGELLNAISLLSKVSQSIENEGYTNPSKQHYFISFKIDQKIFPLNLDSVIDSKGRFDSSKRMDAFQLVEYDKTNNYIIIETPAFLSEEICFKILKARSKPFICKYNAAMNTIDIKSGCLKEIQANSRQDEKIKYLIDSSLSLPSSNIQFRNSTGISLSNSNNYSLRKISEYYYACDHIKRMCKKRGMNFVDMDVIVGPTEKLFGRGVVGGFMGKKQFENSKLRIPHEIVKGLVVSPPIMAVDSISMPSYAQQTETLIHEYSHNLYSILNPDYEHLYNKDPKLRKNDKFKYWDLYLSDPDERLAHKEEIEYKIFSGESADEIIRDKIGGSVCAEGSNNNYPIALKFKDLVEEAMLELEMI